MEGLIALLAVVVIAWYGGALALGLGRLAGTFADRHRRSMQVLGWIILIGCIANATVLR